MRVVMGGDVVVMGSGREVWRGWWWMLGLDCRAGEVASGGMPHIGDRRALGRHFSGMNTRTGL